MLSGAGGLVLGAILVAVAGTVWFLQRPKTLSVPIGGKIVLDDTPYGDVAFNADRLTAEFRATLAPGHYAVGAPEGRYTLVAGLGALYGDRILAFFATYYKPAALILAGLAGIGVAFTLVKYLRARHRHARASAGESQQKTA